MLNRRLENEEDCTSRLTFRLDFSDNLGVSTSFKGEVTGNVTELDKLYTKTLDELLELIGSKEFPRIQLERFTRSTDIKPMGTLDEFNVF